MNKEKISSQEIIDLIALKASISKRASEEFLKVMISTIEEALMAEESVKIKNFGAFKLHWNEPRKSVNVQTGEDIVINGYYKVNFTPDAVLKQQVNEPFAHLEPVRLDDISVAESTKADDSLIENVTQSTPADDYSIDEVAEPLRIFTEQASEIKNLLSEIQALSYVHEEEENEELDEDEDEELIENIIYSKPEIDFVEEGLEFLDENIVVDSELITDSLIEDLDDEILLIGEVAVSNEVVNEAESKVESETEAVLETVPEFESKEESESKTEIALETVKEFESEVESGYKTESVTVVESAAEVKDAQALFNPTRVESSVNEGSNSDDKQKLLLDEKDEDVDFKSFLNQIERVERRKKGLIWSVIILLFILIVGGLFVVNFTPTIISDFVNGIDSIGNNADKKTPAPATLVLPKENFDEFLEDTVVLSDDKKTEPVDSLQIMFDTPREYIEFIAVVMMKEGNRLTLISKKYYGHPDFWVYIYEANSDRFTNPDEITTGSLVHVPKLDPRLIDASNPRCIKKAKELHDLYVND